MNTNTQRPSGFSCPACKGFIPVSMLQLVNAEPIECPLCRLQIMINKERSQKAISALQKVKEAEDNVKKASVFQK